MKSAPIAGRLLALVLAGVALSLVIPRAAAAQPFGAWVIVGPSQGYIQVPSSPDLNPTAAITIEAWVTVQDSGGCSSIVGKGFTTTWWLGICGTTFRSYLKGTASLFDAGTLNSNWNHIAVTFDGTNRKHYINGELVGTFPETGPLPTNTAAMRIGSDVSFDHHPIGAINELRFWNIARTVDQIRGSINVPITSAQPGLVAVWGLNGNPLDSIGGHNGAPVGTVNYLDFAVTLNCGSGGSTSACLSTRYSVSVTFRDPNTGATGVGQVVGCPNPDSALFWFFSSNAWELMVKIINGCTLNSRYWAFSAATTNVFYRLEVIDVRAGVAKIYFNYPGPAAPAVTDTAAFATCP